MTARAAAARTRARRRRPSVRRHHLRGTRGEARRIIVSLVVTSSFSNKLEYEAMKVPAESQIVSLLGNSTEVDTEAQLQSLDLSCK